MKPDRKCPICGGEFETGVIADRGVNFTRQILLWGKKLKGIFVLEGQKDTVTYRCTKCGYLESYATADSNNAF